MTPDDRAYAIEAFGGLAGNTVAVYGRELVQLAGRGNVRAWCDALLSGSHAAATAIAWKVRGDMLAAEYSPSTISLRIATLRSLVGRAHAVGRVSWRLSVPGLRQTARHYGVTLADVCALLGDAQASPSPIGARDFAMLRCIFDLRLRSSEIVGLDLADLRLRESVVDIRGKGLQGGKNARQLPSLTQGAIEAWLAVRRLCRPSSQALFYGFNYHGLCHGRMTSRGWTEALARRSLRACGRRISPHGLCHASITAALDLGISPRDVAKFSRHRDLRTLQGYDDRRTDPSGDVAALVSELAVPSSPAREIPAADPRQLAIAFRA